MPRPHWRRGCPMADESAERLTDAELWRGVEATVRDVLLPALNDDWARAVAVQLVGVARYAQRRPADGSEQRMDELRTVLADMGDNSLVAAHRPVGRTPAEVQATVAAVLAAAVVDDTAEGDEV